MQIGTPPPPSPRTLCQGSSLPVASDPVDRVELSGDLPSVSRGRPRFPASTKPEWIQRSDRATQRLLDIGFEDTPEDGSAQGLAQYDSEILVPTRAHVLATRSRLREFQSQIQQQMKEEKDRRVLQDYQILSDSIQQNLSLQEYSDEHQVPFFNPTAHIYAGLSSLLDDQNPPERWQAATTRLRKYTGLEPGYEPLASILRQRTEEQMQKPDMLYPSRAEVENALLRNSQLLDGMKSLLESHSVQDWQAPLETLKGQLGDYDAWLRQNVLPKTRENFQLPSELYEKSFRAMGISEVTPTELAGQARQAFREIQAEMQQVSSQLATQKGLPDSDYREVLRSLKREQIPPDQVLPLYQSRLEQIEGIIQEKGLVSLPPGKAVIRLATPAEAAAFPAPQMIPPPLVNNNGQRGQFVLPLTNPDGQQFDDFTYNAISWPVTAHEARPGHEMQFDSMVDKGVSLARAIYAANSANIEGWGLYSEWMVQPYMPLEGQLATLSSRLLRAARAFLDPELHSGKLSPDQAREILSKDVLLSPAMVDSEVERYTFRAPTQACSYYYGYDQLRKLRGEVEQKMGKDFPVKEFHDFVLDQGLLPPPLLRQAVLEKFTEDGFSAGAPAAKAPDSRGRSESVRGEIGWG